jgi:hypothetical protein
MSRREQTGGKGMDAMPMKNRKTGLHYNGGRVGTTPAYAARHVGKVKASAGNEYVGTNRQSRRPKIR